MKVKVESSAHLERIAEDIRKFDGEVRIEIKGPVDSESLYRAICKLIGVEPREIPEEERIRRELFKALAGRILKERGISWGEVPSSLLRRAKEAIRWGTKGDVLDVVRELETWADNKSRKGSG